MNEMLWSRKSKLPKEPLSASIQQDAPLSSREVGSIVVFSLLFFAGITILNNIATIVLTLLALFSCIRKQVWGRFRALFSIPLIGALLFAITTCVAAIYTPMDQIAATEFYIFLVPFALLVIMLANFEKRHMRGLICGLLIVMAAVAVLSTDVATGQWLFTPFNALMHVLGSDFDSILKNNVNGRLNGLYNDANITGSMFAMAYFLGLHLYRTEQGSRKKQLCRALLLGVNLSGLLLSASRGAMLCFAISCLAYLAVTTERRLGLFLLLVESAIAAVVTGFPASALVLRRSELAVALMFACGVVFFGLDLLIGHRLEKLLVSHRKAALGLVGGVALLLASYLVAGVSITGPYTFSESGQANFLLPDAPGGYSLSLNYTGDVSLMVYSQTPLERNRSGATILYEGPAEGCSYEVAESASEVHLRVFGESGTVVNGVTVSDGSRVKLTYPLLPHLISDRLHDKLLGGDSFNMRLEFDRDAWKLFLNKPILGYGLGASEGFFMAVQRFYYESRYVHNHLLQIMANEGLLGTIPAVLFVVGCGYLALRAARRNRDELCAVLVAVWVMMNLHSLMEINFSVRPYRAFAYLLLGLMLLAVPSVSPTKPNKKSVAAARVFCGVLTAYLLVCLVLISSHIWVQRKIQTYEADNIVEYEAFLRRCILLDKFDQEELMLSYLAYVDGDGPQQEYRIKCLTKLMGYQTYTAGTGLAHYYYIPHWNLNMAAVCSIEGIHQKASYADAWNLELRGYRDNVFYAVNELTIDDFISAVLAIRDALDDYNARPDALESVVLAEDVQQFVDAAASVRTQGLTGEAALAAMQLLLA